MSFTPEGNRKMAARIKDKYGRDADGKSLHHQAAGRKSSGNPNPYFLQLKTEDPDRLRGIAQRAAAIKNGNNHASEAPQGQ